MAKRPAKTLDPAVVITAVSGPICSGFTVDPVVYALGLYCLARALGRTPDAEVQALIDSLLVRVNRSEDPRVVFKWRPGGRSTMGTKSVDRLRAGHPDARRKLQHALWRDQLMAAEVLRLVRLHSATEAGAKKAVAAAFEVELRMLERALEAWREELEGGDLDRYLARLKEASHLP